MTLKHHIRINKKFIQLLGVQVDELKKLQEHLPLVKESLIDIYQNIFPKKCNCCGTVFHNHDEYIEKTTPIDNSSQSSGTSVDYDRILEYRNCHCRSTMLIVFNSRRDQTEFGLKRRDLFKECVKIILKDAHLTHEQANLIVRNIFQEVEKHLEGHIVKDFSNITSSQY